MNNFEEENSNCKTVENYIENVFQFFYGYKNPLLLLYENGLSLSLLEVLNKHFGKKLNNESSTEDKYLVMYHIGGVFNHFLFWFSRDMRDSPKVLAKTALDTLPKGFKPFLLKSDEK